MQIMDTKCRRRFGVERVCLHLLDALFYCKKRVLTKKANPPNDNCYQTEMGTNFSSIMYMLDLIPCSLGFFFEVQKIQR
jgi:hypothetical protein